MSFLCFACLGEWSLWRLIMRDWIRLTRNSVPADFVQVCVMIYSSASVCCFGTLGHNAV